MPDKITQEQFEELVETRDCFGPERYVKTMELATGIIVRPYTGYQYFNPGGEFLGDSEWNSLSEILEEAGIEVVEDG